MSKHHRNVHDNQSYKQKKGPQTDKSVVSLSEKEDIHTYIKDEAIIEVLLKKGIEKLFPIQYETFNIIYEGNDIVAKDRTGSGKTIAFALPMMMRLREKLSQNKHKPRFLIILPTRELAIQVKDEILSLCVPKKKV